jgi:SOS response regulatory protein OraA/RecX
VPGGASSSPSAEPGNPGCKPGDERRAEAGDPLRTILSIELRGAGGETATVRLSDGSSFLAPAEIVAGEGLSTGAALDVDRLQSLRSRSELVLARTRALSLISRSAHTRRALARKLEARGFSPEAVKAAIDRMAELGYLDDRAFAFDWARARVTGRAEGWKAVYRGLLGRGVPRTIAGEAATEVCSDEAELEMARKLAGNLSPRTASSRLAARGFRSRTIARVLREIAGRPSVPE